MCKINKKKNINESSRVTLKNIQKKIFRTQLLLIVTLASFLGVAGTLINIHFETKKRDQNLQNVAQTIAGSPILKGDTIEEKSNDDFLVLKEYLDSLKDSLGDIDVISVVNSDNIRLYHSNHDLIGTVYDGTDPNFRNNSNDYYVADDSGPSGTQRRAYAAVYDDGEYKGFVMAITLMKNIREETLQTLFIFLLFTLAAIFMELMISSELSNKIKKSLLGYEPDVFSAMYQIRDNILESLDEGIIAIDGNANIQFVNQAAVEMLNNDKTKTVEDIVNKPLESICNVKLLKNTLESGLKEFNVQERDIGNSDILIDRIPIKEDANVIGAVGILHNRTEYTKLMEDLIGTRYLVDSMRANNHDFTNKLHVILGLIQMEMYDEAVKELNLEVMSRPEVSVDSIEEGKPVVVTCEVAVKPEVTLGEYKGLEVEAEDATVTEEDVNAEIERIANRNARMVEVTDRAAQMDDILTIDFEGFMDGVAFAGGKGENHDLKLGSHSFIDTFEDQLVGKNVGDECEVNVTFPAEYHQKDLAGKPAMFKVAVKAIKFNEVPEINDEFVKEVSEFDTLDEYKADTKKNLEERKAKQVEESRKAKLLSKVVETSTMDMPEPMVLEQCDQMINNFAQTLRYQGMDMQKYMEMTGSTIDTMRQSVRSEAERRLKESLVLEAIAKAENLEATDEDVEKELETMASMYGMEVDKLKAAVTEAETESIKGELKTKKALDFIAENAKA